MVQIDRAKNTDLPEVLRLLERNHLPLAGVADHLATLIVARAHGEIVGSAALEMYPNGALLRSVAVDSAAQGQGIGQRLTQASINMAAEAGISAVYLLTTTADGFFPRFGFERITREEVPDDVQRSIQFTSACPASAVVMRKRL